MLTTSETTESGKVDTTAGWDTDEAPLTYTPQSVKVYADSSESAHLNFILLILYNQV